MGHGGQSFVTTACRNAILSNAIESKREFCFSKLVLDPTDCVVPLDQAIAECRSKLLLADSDVDQATVITANSSNDIDTCSDPSPSASNVPEPEWELDSPSCHAHSIPHLSDDQCTVSTTGAACVSVSDDQLMAAMSDVTASTFAPGDRSIRKRGYIEAFGRQVSANALDRFSKQPNLSDSTANRRAGGRTFARLDKRRARPGHSYSQIRIEGHTRVHMGDQIGDQVTINHNYLGISAAMNVRHDQHAEPIDKATVLRLAASIIVLAIANAFLQPLLFLHCTIQRAVQRRAPSLLNLFGSRTVLFEDALGRFERIDINVVTDWTTFHYNLTRSFLDQPGYRRVAVAGYRLFDRAQDGVLVDPKHPPLFASMFRPRKHIRMSIHFEWSEVSVESCPKCGLERTCEPGIETTCENKNCGLHYRGMVEEHRIEELEDDTTGNNLDGYSNIARKKLLKDERENPCRFGRISVSKQPQFARRVEEIAGNSTGDELGSDRGTARKKLLKDEQASLLQSNRISASWQQPALQATLGPPDSSCLQPDLNAAVLFDDTVSSVLAHSDDPGRVKVLAPRYDHASPTRAMPYWTSSMEELTRIPGWATKRDALHPPVVNTRLDALTADLKHRIVHPSKYLTTAKPAQQHVCRYDGPASFTVAPPILSLPSQIPDDEPELFQMDSLEFTWQGEDFDCFSFWLDEIDHGQVRRKNCRYVQ